MSEDFVESFSSKLGEQLARLRKQKGMTQGELGFLLTEQLQGKYSQPVIARMEAGSRSISTEELVNYCKAIESDPSVVLSEVTGQTSENRLLQLAVEADNLSDQFRELSPKFQSLFDRCQQALYDHFKGDESSRSLILTYLPAPEAKKETVKSIKEILGLLGALSFQARGYARGKAVDFLDEEYGG